MKAMLKVFPFLSTILFAATVVPPQNSIAPQNPSSVLRPNDPISAPVRPDDRNRLPTDIYADYAEAKRIWGTQNVAKAEVVGQFQQYRQAIALELKVSEGLLNATGPRVAQDGNICTAYSIDRSNLPVGNIGDVTPRMEALARSLSEKNDSPLDGTNVYATHYRSLAAEGNAEIQLMTACLVPDRI